MSFIRWCGGKGQSVKHILPLLLNVMNELEKEVPDELTYVEPFLGSGIVLISLLRHYRDSGKSCRWNFTCSDINSYLIDAFIAVQNNLEELIDELDKYDLDDIMNEQTYYELRDIYNGYVLDNVHTLESTALFIILNKLCFKGIYQVSKKGRFTTPFGKKQILKKLYSKKLLIDLHILFNIYDVEFIHANYLDYSFGANDNIVMYLDPPYYGTFNSYDKDKFSYLEFDEWLVKNINYPIVMSNKITYLPPMLTEWNFQNTDIAECMHPKNHNLRREEVLYWNF